MHLVGQSTTLEFAGQRAVVVAEGAADAEGRYRDVLRLLTAEDRRLATLLFVDGLSYRAAAAQVGVPAYAVARRAVRLRRILHCPTCRAIAQNLEALSPAQRKLAIDSYFLGLSARLIAIHRGVGRGVIARELDYIRGWARALQRAGAMASRLDLD